MQFWLWQKDWTENVDFIDRVDMARKAMFVIGILSMVSFAVSAVNLICLDQWRASYVASKKPTNASMLPALGQLSGGWSRLDLLESKVDQMLSSQTIVLQLLRELPVLGMKIQLSDRKHEEDEENPKEQRQEQEEEQEEEPESPKEQEVKLYDEPSVQQILENYQEILSMYPLPGSQQHTTFVFQTLEALNYDPNLDTVSSSNQGSEEGEREQPEAEAEEEEGTCADVPAVEEETDSVKDELAAECYDNIPCNNHKKTASGRFGGWF